MHLTPVSICSLSSPAMQRQTVLSLLLACAVSLSNSAFVQDDGMPLYWNQLGDPSLQNGVMLLDPWKFTNRMGLYQLMIESTNGKMGSMGIANGSPMFGLAVQLGWMQDSERLADPSGETNCGMKTGDPLCISPKSWWACENYFVSVLPFLSAAQKGVIMDGIQIQTQSAVTEYCTTHADCSTHFPDVMTKWDAFFQGLQDSVGSTLPENEKKDILLGLFWAAQMASTYASSACDARKASLSGPEISFAASWLNLTEFVAAAHFQSSLDLASKFIAPMPHRVLKEGDVAPNIEGLSEEENRLLDTFAFIDSTNYGMGGTLLSTWQKAMCTAVSRESGRELLERILQNGRQNAFSFLGHVLTMALQCGS